MIISLIAAISQNHVIGNKGTIPWSIPGDLPRFKNLTMGHCMVMGRKTYESIGRVLPGRTTIILTSQKKYTQEGAVIVHSPEKAIEAAKKLGEKELFVIGGGEIYKLFMPITDKIYLTIVYKDFKGDTFFPEFKDNEWKTQSNEKGSYEEGGFDYEFKILSKK